MKHLAAAATVLLLLAGCGQAPVPFQVDAADQESLSALASIKNPSEKAKALIAKKLNAYGATYGDVEEITVKATDEDNEFSFTLIKIYQDKDENAWRDTFTGTCNVKTAKIKSKRTNHEEY